MKKILAALLIIFLLASLAGNILLYRQSTATAVLLADTQNKLTQEQSALALSKTNNATLTADLSQSRIDLAQAKTDVGDLREKFTKARNEKNIAYESLSAMRCSVDIPRESIQGVTTSQGLIDPITKAVETGYSETIVSTNFDNVFNNSKTAIFTLRSSDNSSVKVVATWSFKVAGRLLTVYDVNTGCVLYSWK